MAMREEDGRPFSVEEQTEKIAAGVPVENLTAVTEQVKRTDEAQPIPARGEEPRLVPCRVCRHKIARDAATCPSCGTNMPSKSDAELEAQQPQMGTGTNVGGESGIERKLVAILSADVQGYSRLMEDDEVATVRTLTSYREVMADLIRQHRGRVVDAPGDNVLAEFVSVVDAVQCAVAIQPDLTARNAGLPPHRQMAFRIGINLADVIVEGERIYGEGINIAACIEGLAEAGGVCISASVYEQVRNKLALRYEDLGQHTVKNCTEPVRVYRVGIEPAPTASSGDCGER